MKTKPRSTRIARTPAADHAEHADRHSIIALSACPRSLRATVVTRTNRFTVCYF
jgi:hypothetical protein